MHKFILILATVAAMTASLDAAAQQGQTSELPDPMELAAKMADQLERELELDAGQVFKVDTLFQHIYREYYAEVEKMAKAGVQNTSGQYLRVSDKWGDYSDKVLETILTEGQWAKYLKGNGGKNKKAREKRMAKDKY